MCFAAQGSFWLRMILWWLLWWQCPGCPALKSNWCGRFIKLAEDDDHNDIDDEDNILLWNPLDVQGSSNWRRMMTIMTLMTMTTSFSKILLMFKVHPIGGGEQHAGVPGHRQRCPREQDHLHDKQSSKLFFFFIVINFKAFGSISMMLESSFHAVHSSFQVKTMKWIGP